MCCFVLVFIGIKRKIGTGEWALARQKNTLVEHKRICCEKKNVNLAASMIRTTRV